MVGEEVRIKEDTIAGRPVVVFVGTLGDWRVKAPDGEQVGSGDTLERAMSAARSTLAKRRTQVDVRFLTLDGFKPAVATGLHAGTGNVLVKVGSARAEQMTGYAPSGFEPDMPEDKQRRLKFLAETIKAAKQEQREIHEQYTFRLDERVKDAITAELEASQ